MDCAMNICTRCRVEILVNLTDACLFFLASNPRPNSYEFACQCKPLKTKRRKECCGKLPANRADFYARGRGVKGYAGFKGSLILSGLFVFQGTDTRVRSNQKPDSPKRRSFMATKRRKRITASDLDWTEEFVKPFWESMTDEMREEFYQALNEPPREFSYEDAVEELRQIFHTQEPEPVEPMPTTFSNADVFRGHALGVIIETEIGPKLGLKAKRPL
jgi:hypothetical protein